MGWTGDGTLQHSEPRFRKKNALRTPVVTSNSGKLGREHGVAPPTKSCATSMLHPFGNPRQRVLDVERPHEWARSAGSTKGSLRRT